MSRRIRHHIDPLKCRIQLTRKDWVEKYDSRQCSIGIDVGCGKGDFITELAKLFPDNFYIGVDIRDKLKERYFTKYEDVSNLALLIGNINLSLTLMFEDYKLDSIYVNFPDPYSKKRRHKKRRMVTKDLVRDMHSILADNGRVFFQTDDNDLFKETDILFRNEFSCLTDMCESNQVENITGSRTSWEKECIRKGVSIYRAIYIKREKDSG